MMNQQRRDHDHISIKVVDDSDANSLTVSELKELKWLANASRFTKWILAIIFGVLSLTWLPDLVEAYHRHK